jgi:hypothetical protein
VKSMSSTCTSASPRLPLTGTNPERATACATAKMAA